MIFITGGAYQGKKDYALSLGIAPEDIVDGAASELDKLGKFVCLTHFEAAVKKLVEKGEDPVLFTERLIKDNGDSIIISTEIGGGIIPVDKNERIWREETGKCCCKIAEAADVVVRMVCGIPVRIK